MTNATAFRTLRDELNQRHYERYDEIEIALAAILTRQHVVLIGPPGTAKSMLAEDLTQVFTGANLFKYLLTKFTTPEEIFGPWDLAALKEGRYERITAGKLPEAHIAFEDEVFKANSAVLNAQLTIMNEREFDNGTQRTPVPLMTIFAASNEMPEGEELWALFDRFQFRKRVDYIQEPGNFIAMLKAAAPPVTSRISLDDVHAAQEAVASIEISDDVRDTLYEIRADLIYAGVVVSDRRFQQSQMALKALAYLVEDRDTVTDEEFRILEHMLWTQPTEAKTVARVIRKHTNPLEIQVQEIADATDEIAQKLHTAVVEANSKNVDTEQVLVKQGIDWFTNCQTLGKKLTALAKEAEKKGRPLNSIERTRDRLLMVMKEIGRHTIGLEGFELDI
jgi:MoxR-like ATPase